MYKIILLIAFACAVFACKKDNNPNSGSTDNISRINASWDNENIIKTYSANQLNEFAEYSFSGVAGNYFGFISSFRINDKEKIEIRFGTLLSSHSSLTHEEILTIISPGSKNFGSLGAYSSYPQLKPGCAEIAFTDKNSTRWCSTHISERQTDYGIETNVEIDQPQSEFVIDKVKKVPVSKNEGYLVTGHFVCTLYEVNDEHQKKIKGNFSGIVSNSN